LIGGTHTGGIVLTGDGVVFTAGGDGKENVFTAGAVGEKGEDGEKSGDDDEEEFRDKDRLGDISAEDEGEVVM